MRGERYPVENEKLMFENRIVNGRNEKSCF